MRRGGQEEVDLNSKEEEVLDYGDLEKPLGGKEDKELLLVIVG